MRQWPLYALALFFILLYTQGILARVGVPKLVMDGTLLALPVAVLWCQRGLLHRPAPGFLFVWFYLGWSLAACIYNDEGVLRGLLYARYLVGSYLVFWAVWSSRFTPRELLRINAVIFTLFFVQVVAASFHCLVLGRKDEFVVGLMAYGGGGPATVFPVFAFSCMLAFFLYYGRLLFLIAAFSFFVVGYASGKLGIYYLIPTLLLLGVILYAHAEGVRRALRRSAVVALVLLCALPFLVFLLGHTERGETMSMQQEVGLYHKAAAFFSYSSAVETQLQGRWYVDTRMGTSRRVLEETLHRGPLVFLFGRGPHLATSESTEPGGETLARYGIRYGIVGWATDAFAIGWPAMVAHLGFYTYLLYVLLRTRSGGSLTLYWKAILLAVKLGFFVFLLDYLLYSSVFAMGRWVSSVYLCFLAVLLGPQYREALGIPRIVSPRPTAGAAPRGDRGGHPDPVRSPRPSLL